MKLNTYNNFKSSEALSTLPLVRKFQMATAFVGKPLFTFGDIRFHNTSDVKERLILSSMQARANPDNVHIVTAPAFAAVLCRTKKDFDAVMGVVHGRAYDGGRTLTVQVTDQTDAWHNRVEVEFLQPANQYLRNQGLSNIDVLRVSDRCRDYCFPSQLSMKRFCEFVETKLPAETKTAKHGARLG